MGKAALKKRRPPVVSSSSALGSSASGLWESSEMSIDTLVTTDGSTDRVLDETELLEKHLAMEKAARKQARTRTSFAPFDTKNVSFYQDRFGTNIGKALKESRGSRRSARPRSGGSS